MDTTKQTTILTKLREQLNKVLEKNKTEVTTNEKEISTSTMGFGVEGKIKIRLLPPLDLQDPFFYRTHSYNYLPNVGEGGSDLVLFSLKYFEENGKKIKNPIDVLVREIYNSKDENLIRRIASVSKRKRKFYFNCLLLGENGSEHKIFIDATNKGEVTKRICELMSVPFFRDTEDSWVAETTPEEEPYDLLDLELGHDITISKIKTGQNNWDVEYKVVVSKNPRPLSQNELKLLPLRVDLKNYVKYETSLANVKEYVRKLLGDEKFSGLSGKLNDITKVSEKEIEKELTEVKTTKQEKEELEEVLSLLEEQEVF